jgi:hypothetical protein
MWTALCWLRTRSIDGAFVNTIINLEIHSGRGNLNRLINYKILKEGSTAWH